MSRDQIWVPRIERLRDAPEMAILAALEVALAATISALHAVHPELLDAGVDPGDRTLHVADAEAIARQAAALIASIDRYRPDIDDRHDDLF